MCNVRGDLSSQSLDQVEHGPCSAVVTDIQCLRRIKARGKKALYPPLPFSFFVPFLLPSAFLPNLHAHAHFTFPPRPQLWKSLELEPTAMARRSPKGECVLRGLSPQGWSQQPSVHIICPPPKGPACYGEGLDLWAFPSCSSLQS